MVEEQALCRVHRVGQQREVTTVRYLMRDSLEEVRLPSRHEHFLENIVKLIYRSK
jgi:hypothetical protein